MSGQMTDINKWMNALSYLHKNELIYSCEVFQNRKLSWLEIKGMEQFTEILINS
jgi:hypothetical protein